MCDGCEKKRTFVAMNERHIDINEFDYDLPDGRIAKFPLAERSASKLLVYRGGEIGEAHFADIADVLPEGQLLVFNNTKVIRARIIMHKPSGARIEVFCLEPHDPACCAGRGVFQDGCREGGKLYLADPRTWLPSDHQCDER